MKIRIISVGKTKEQFWRLAEVKFADRIQRYADLDLVVVRDASLEATRNVGLVKKLEAEKIMSKIEPGNFVIALDKDGRHMPSEEFARFIDQKMLHGVKCMAFVVGGPLGLSSDFVSQCQMSLSLSKMTLPHELAKIFLLEQIYRAFTIIKGEKYHK